ncbi:zinc ribbon domain-containing protein [Saccharothrix violaceirubra]|uniref:Zinc-ribbon domain-containing protein n=1 Tax=Saccharothrix violaceirubra TaxID=413306 RepID=A0A7W7T2N8_9PSEU|nr:zinc ribbon domain-containing protein [Saccharothrix violaceirubra]MBB4965406.1 hypothetical protein [Saccharothrix violaceirubra]
MGAATPGASRGDVGSAPGSGAAPGAWVDVPAESDRRDLSRSGAAGGVGEPRSEREAGYLGPVAPGRPDAKRPLPSTHVDGAVDGPPCPRCGVPNPPGRRFCRRCGEPLYDQAVASSGRRRKRRWRGDRSRWLRRSAAAAVAVALAVTLWVFHPELLALWEDLRDRLATPAPVAPTSVTANAAVPDHPATAAADGLSNRYWGAPAVGDAVEFGFAAPFRLLSVVVHTGASAEKDGFAAQARPSALDMVVTTADGTTRTVPITLADQPGPQRTDTGIGNVVRVRLVVRSATGLGEGRHIALGEVEFFRRP